MTTYERLLGSPAILPGPLFVAWIACLIGAPLLLIVVPSATIGAAGLLVVAGGLSIPSLAGEPLTSPRRLPMAIGLVGLLAASFLVSWQGVRPTPSFLSGALLVAAIVGAGASLRQRATRVQSARA
jgi:hypothetical protein